MPLNVLLDSGAFTAWKSGKPIDINAYCNFLQANIEWVGDYAVLDHIDPKDPETAAARSMDNFLYMRERGLRPMPIFHIGEDIKWLYRMLDMGADYIGLSASSLVGMGAVNKWYDTIWSHLVSREGKPIARFHAFGEGRKAPLIRHPWQSADSTTWLFKAQKTGLVILDDRTRLSQRKDNHHLASQQDVDRLMGLDRATYLDLLGQCGISPNALTNRDRVSFIARTYLMARFYIRMESEVRLKSGMQHPPNLFAQGYRAGVGKSLATPFRKYLVIGTNPVAEMAVAVAGGQNVLISYAHLTKRNINTTKRFVRDPMGTVLSNPAHLRLYNSLKEHLTPC